MLNNFFSHFNKKEDILAASFPNVFRSLYNTPSSIYEQTHKEVKDAMTRYVLRGQYEEKEGEVTLASSPVVVSPNGTAIIKISGVLLPSATLSERLHVDLTTYKEIEENLDESVEQVKAGQINDILLDVNSGGGSCNGLFSLVYKIQGLVRSGIKINALVNGIGCSAAYCLIAPCNNVYLTPSSEVGSLGVFTTLYDTAKVYQNAGIDVKQIKTSPLKGQGVDGVPIMKEFEESLMKKANKVHSMMYALVQESRSPRSMDEVFSGDTFMDEDAVSEGLADAVIENKDELLAYA